MDKIMKENLEIARKLRSSSIRFGKRHPLYKRMYKKCYWSYVKDCIFKKGDIFYLSLIDTKKCQEILLEKFLKKNKFEIICRHIDDSKFVYKIARI